jgi:divalent metal cation (Fe/Co/Zn/Cd) transporter
MHLSLIFGFAMLIGKTAAYFMTQSAADFSEAAESVIHVIAVGFATISSNLSLRALPHRSVSNRSVRQPVCAQ